jgi:uracil DNA glycosylase
MSQPPHPEVPTGATPNADDPLALTELFGGGGEGWLPALRPIIERQARAAAFIGPARGKGVVPVRELTFQALKPNPPHRWKVVVFGQNPYPRVESATGIAMLDNTFNAWADGRFGRVTSVRCIIKAAAMWKHGVPKATSAAELRALLAKTRVVQPPEWFQAMLAQGVLLLNASLTASADGAMATEEHTMFWRPVVERIVEEILRAKQAASGDERGVVFAWWGTHARALRGVVEALCRRYPGVPVRHVDHCNPAAMADAFCDGAHFADLNRALASVRAAPVDWLPEVGWNHREGTDAHEASRMGAFVSQTMELHKVYLERLQSVRDETMAALPEITGIGASPLMSFGDAVAPVARLLGGLEGCVQRSLAFARESARAADLARAAPADPLTEHEIAAVFLYTTASAFYRQLNAALRDPDRARIGPYRGYLRLFLSALSKLEGRTEPLFRGVPLDMRAQYPRGATVAWWGVSSCTSRRSVAEGFLGARGRRTLFEITPAMAVGIQRLSAFTGEEEFVLLPGTQLLVRDARTERDGLTTIQLEELAGQRLLS